ncbi:RmlC-like cupin domain-containing protein [Bombardia bombarda]|uniref:RmlC-like cupin domain-containing protein n=1 Tax=Bombardia bombarda TaxID=252184 RepID=A0AA39XAP7_9PEZI|nr:RmlC-like cupin domain-containing protein [Bombardia bombarda]
MASLLPLIQDILPMIMPSSISVTKASDIIPPAPPSPPTETGEGSNEDASRIRVISRDAVVNKTDSMCASVLIVKPKSSSPVRHHGEQVQDTIIYAASGKGVLLSSPKDEGDEPVRYDLDQGDFAVVPPWTEHQALNESEGDLLWVVIRNGPQPVEVNLTDWGGSQVTDASKR